LRGRPPRSGVEVWKLRSGGGGGSAVVVNVDARCGGCCGCALRRHEHERAPARMPAVESRSWL
jgi:hypothetical protein